VIALDLVAVRMTLDFAGAMALGIAIARVKSDVHHSADHFGAVQTAAIEITFSWSAPSVMANSTDTIAPNGTVTMHGRVGGELRTAAVAVLRRITVAVLIAAFTQLVSMAVERLLARSVAPRSTGAIDADTARGATEYERALFGCVSPPAPGVSLADLEGIDALREELRLSAVLPLRNPRAFFSGRLRGVRPTRGVILVGPPGTGKTTIACAIAAEAGARTISLTLADIENKYFGETPRLLAAAFSLAEKLQPCVLFLDEVDGMMRERSADEGSATYGLKTELLARIDALQRGSSAVLVVAATNHARGLDSALKRRLPCICQVGLPEAPARARILRALLVRREPIHATELDEPLGVQLAAATEGYSGSDLGQLYEAASALRLRGQLAGDATWRKTLLTATDATDSELEQLERTLPALGATDWDGALRHVATTRRNRGFSTSLGTLGNASLDSGGRQAVDRAADVLTTVTPQRIAPVVAPTLVRALSEGGAVQRAPFSVDPVPPVRSDVVHEPRTRAVTEQADTAHTDTAHTDTAPPDVALVAYTDVVPVVHTKRSARASTPGAEEAPALALALAGALAGALGEAPARRATRTRPGSTRGTPRLSAAELATGVQPPIGNVR
jgi:predicted AAA+ superfamily ATPase